MGGSVDGWMGGWVDGDQKGLSIYLEFVYSGKQDVLVPNMAPKTVYDFKTRNFEADYLGD